MGSINTGRVVLGGLLAGVIAIVSEAIFFRIFFSDIQELFETHNFAARGTALWMPVTAVVFLLTIIAIWFYATARPRFGPGPRTALMVFLPLWFVVRSTEIVFIMFGVDVRLILLHAIWTLVAGAVAMLAGAWAYQEE